MAIDHPQDVEVGASAVGGLDVAGIVRRAAAGDEAAWNDLVDLFAGTVWAIARAHRLSPADAADVSQTTWLRLVEHLDTVRQPERIGAWLATTARRESLRVIRLRDRQVADGRDMERLPDRPSAASPIDDLLQDERERVLTALVDQLPTRFRLIVRHLGGESPLSYRQLSETLEMPIGSIGPTRARGLQHLRRLAVRAGLDACG